MSQKRLANSITLMVFGLLFTGRVAGDSLNMRLAGRVLAEDAILTVMMSGSTKSKIQMGTGVVGLKNLELTGPEPAIDTGLGGLQCW